MKVFKARAFVCTGCRQTLAMLLWDDQWPPPCPCGSGTGWEPDRVPHGRAAAVVDDQLEGGPRRFETMGHDAPYIESKSQWRREVEQRGLVNVVKHDSAYYAKQRKLHDEMLRDTGQLKQQPRPRYRGV